MVSAAKKSADALGDIDDAAQRVGVDAETMQELEYVAKQSGLAMSDLEKAAKKLEGTDLNLDQAIDQILALEDAEAQTQMAIELFGESVAYNLQPLLNQGAEGVEEFKNQAHELGIVMSNETVENGAQLGDMFEAVESSLKSLTTGLMGDLMPLVMEILQWVIDNIPIIKETIQKVMDSLLPIIEPILQELMELLPPLLDAIIAILDFIMPYLQPILEAVFEVIHGVFALIQGDTETFFESIKNFWIGLGTALYTIAKDVMNLLWDGLKFVWDKIKTWFDEKVQWVKNIFKSIKEAANGAADIEASAAEGRYFGHASGLNYVPYDGYKAELHRGESVLNAKDTANLLNSLSGLGGSSDQTINVTLTLDGSTLAKQTIKYMNKEADRLGTSLVGV